MTPEQIKKVEDIVNEQIKKELDVSYEEMTVEEAKKRGAIGLFESKYGEKVKVYKIGDFSMEICGGPHVKNTRELGHFKIKKEQSSSAGVRRIKAILVRTKNNSFEMLAPSFTLSVLTLFNKNFNNLSFKNFMTL